MRSPEQLLQAFERATKQSPLILAGDECDNFSKAMKIAVAIEDKRLGHKSSQITIQDRDILLKDGILSPLDQKTAFHNRRDWANHLKANGCVEVGNDFNNSAQKKRELQGDFDCRKELAQATHQIMKQYGY